MTHVFYVVPIAASCLFLIRFGWAKAYAEPINRSDTRYVWRNLWACDKMRECIEFKPDGIFLDYAASAIVWVGNSAGQKSRATAIDLFPFELPPL
jgi:hypothetical protein